MCSNTEKSKKQLLEEILELQKTVKQLYLNLKESQIEVEKANQLKFMFLSNISHELRTPMNGIIGIYNVLKQTELTEEQNNFLDIINTSGHNLISLIDDILDLSKIEAGTLILENDLFNLHNEINKIVKLLIFKSKGKGIQLITNFDKILICFTQEIFAQFLFNQSSKSIYNQKEKYDKMVYSSSI